MKKFVLVFMAIAVLGAVHVVADDCIDGRTAKIRCALGGRLTHDGCAGPEYMVHCVPSPLPGPVPGPTLTLDHNSLEVIEALSKNLGAFEEFSKVGNRIVNASVVRRSPSVTDYSVISQYCFEGGANGGRCLGGAHLRIRKSVTRGNMPKTVYESKVDLIR